MKILIKKIKANRLFIIFVSMFFVLFVTIESGHCDIDKADENYKIIHTKPTEKKQDSNSIQQQHTAKARPVKVVCSH